MSITRSAWSVTLLTDLAWCQRHRTRFLIRDRAGQYTTSFEDPLPLDQAVRFAELLDRTLI